MPGKSIILPRYRPKGRQVCFLLVSFSGLSVSFPRGGCCIPPLPRELCIAMGLGLTFLTPAGEGKPAVGPFSDPVREKGKEMRTGRKNKKYTQYSRIEEYMKGSEESNLKNGYNLFLDPKVCAKP